MRHGLSEMNKAGLYSGHTDTPLTAEGRDQARHAGKGAKNLKIDVIVSSPLKRAHHTAKIIAEEIGYPVNSIILDERFVERHHGVLELQPYVAGTPIDGVEGAEQSHDIVSRAEEALAFLNELGHQHILVVSHGGFGRALRHHVDPEYTYTDISQVKDKLPNAEIIRFI